MKTNLLYSALALASVAVAISSCSPVLYSNVGQNVPLFHKKGEGALSIGFMMVSGDGYAANPFNIVEDNPGLSMQFALAVDSSVAIFSSLNSLKANSDWNVKGSYFEAGGGLFKHNSKTHLIGELFAGIGYGVIKNSSDVDTEVINAKFIKYFIQPSGGFSTKAFDMAFTPRIGVVDYIYHSETDSPLINEFFKEKKTSLVFEPGVTMRFGYKNIKIQYQMNYSTFSYKPNGYDEDEFDPVMDMYGSLSLFILISNRWKP